MISQKTHLTLLVIAFLFFTNFATYGQGCFQNPPISITLLPNHLQCARDSSGSINAIVTGGSGNPMTLIWSNGMTGVDSIGNLPAGTYTLVVIDSFPSGSTTNLYAQAFDGVHGWTLNVQTGVNGAEPNVWVVNDDEGGVNPPGCGAGSNGNKTLHIVCTSLFCGSFLTGAIYNASENSNYRSESPSFSTLGHNNIEFSFNYISNGDSLLDNASVVFSADNGLTWQVLNPSIKSPMCGGQGRWTKFSALLPPSCDNNPNVKLGFNWTNNNDNIGSDPSVAIDSVLVVAMSIDSFLVCIDSQTVTINNPYFYSPQISLNNAQTNSINISWTDMGLPNSGFYEYSLDSGQTWVSVNKDTSITISGLSPSTGYDIWVRAGDSSNLSCHSAIDSFYVLTQNLTCNNIPPVNISLLPNNAFCNGDTLGCISATVTGGSGNPMHWAWSNGAVNVDSICNISFGTYTLVITDTVATNLTPPNYIALYEQNFDGAHGWTLNIPTGVNGADNNFWKVSSDEVGMAVGACSSFGGANQTLHITQVFNPTSGAAYDAGGLCGFSFCPETNMRAASPTFSTLGQSNIEFSFNYIANGDSLTDNASVVFSADNGLTWQVLNPSLKSGLCPAGQGLWTKFSAILPPSCDNNPTVKVGFNWTNNDDGIGSDPSVAIDSVLVSVGGIGSTILTCVDSQTITITDAYLVAPQITCTNASTSTISFSWTDLSLPSGGFYEYSVDNGITWIYAGTGLAATASGLADDTDYNIWVRANNSAYNVCAPSPIGSILCTTLNLCYNNPPISISLTPTHLLTHNDSSGCVHALVTGGSGNPMNFVWSNGAVDVDSICGLSAGNYTLVVTDTFQSLVPYTIYAQTFDGVHDWTLNIPTGVNGSEPNVWIVNDAESGMNPSNCAVGGNGNSTLHIVCTSLFCGAFFSGAIYNASENSSYRAESPTFSTTGQSDIELNFNYIANGDGLLDNTSVVFSADNGLTWQVLNPSIKSPLCGSGQGLWTKFSAILPPSCDNNPNVKIGFNWTNNDDNIGTDPSVAIDSVRILGSQPSFTTLYCVDSQSVTLTEPSLLEIFIDSFQAPSNVGMSDGYIEVSVNGGTPAYQFNWSNGATTEDLTNLGEGIYALTITDNQGAMDTIMVNLMLPNSIVKVKNLHKITLSPNPADQLFNIQCHFDKLNSQMPYFSTGEICLIDALGQVVLQQKITQSTQNVEVSTSQLAVGVYFCKVQLDSEVYIEKVVVRR